MKGKKQAFTLTELLVAMTIFIVIVTFSYIPYSYYQSKAQLRQGVKELEQSLSEVRNMALSWLSSTGNLSLWLYLDTENKNKIRYISYPYSYTWTQITNEIWWEVSLTKELEFPKWVEFNWVLDGNEILHNWLFFFQAISWDGQFYYWDEAWQRHNFESLDLYIKLSYKNSSSQNLQSSIKYYTDNYIMEN